MQHTAASASIFGQKGEWRSGRKNQYPTISQWIYISHKRAGVESHHFCPSFCVRRGKGNWLSITMRETRGMFYDAGARVNVCLAVLLVYLTTCLRLFTGLVGVLELELGLGFDGDIGFGFRRRYWDWVSTTRSCHWDSTTCHPTPTTQAPARAEAEHCERTRRSETSPPFRACRIAHPLRVAMPNL